MNARLLLFLLVGASCSSGGGGADAGTGDGGDTTDSGTGGSGGSGGSGGGSGGSGGGSGGSGGGAAVCMTPPTNTDLSFFDACKTADGGGPYPVTFRVRNAGGTELGINIGPSGPSCATSAVLKRCDNVPFNPQLRCQDSCGCDAMGCAFKYLVLDAGTTADIPFEGFMTAYGCNCRQFPVPPGRYKVTMNFNRRDGTFGLPDGGRLASTKDFELPGDGGPVQIDLIDP